MFVFDILQIASGCIQICSGYTCTPVHWYSGTPVHWYTGTLAHRYTGYTSIPVHQYTSTLLQPCV